MIDDLIEKIKRQENLSVTETETVANEMFRLHELDIAKWGKGTIPSKKSKMAEIWILLHNNAVNLLAVHKLAEDFLFSTMSDFNSNEEFGPVEDPIRALHRKEAESQRISDEKQRNHMNEILIGTKEFINLC